MPDDTNAELAASESLGLESGQVFDAEWKHAKLRRARFVTYSAFKRLLDLIMATGMLIVLSPIFIIAAVAVKLDSPGPIFFRQERTGRHGKVFRILKFRSMSADNDVHDNSHADECTKVGKILRRTSLDELPQLFNVLAGQMSFIGPRPWIPEYWNNMNEKERERGRVRPGITGLAAAKGRNGLTVFQKIAYDLEYVRNFSLKQDIKVIIMTIKTVLDKDVVDAGKGGIHNDVEELKKEDKGPKIRIIIQDDPLVSVVVALGNGEEYITEVISSALGRSCKRVELIAANNDYSSEVDRQISSICSDRFKITRLSRQISHESMGYDGTVGRFWCFVDVKEPLRPSKIVEQLTAARQSEAPVDDSPALLD